MQQNSVRESVQKKQGGAAPACEPLPEGWKEIKDPKTGSTYYWNKVSAWIWVCFSVVNHLFCPPVHPPTTSPVVLHV